MRNGLLWRITHLAGENVLFLVPKYAPSGIADLLQFFCRVQSGRSFYESFS